MFSKNVFSERVRLLRMKKGLNQADLGKIIGLSKQTINGIEQGRRATSIEKLVELADYFDVSIDYLVGRSDDPKRY